MLTSHIIRVAVEAALAEDAPYGDITCETTIPADETGSAHLTARENGVMSGIDVFAAAFAAQNPAVTVTAAIKAINGQELPKIIDSGFAWYDKSNIDDPEIAANLYE